MKTLAVQQLRTKFRFDHEVIMTNEPTIIIDTREQNPYSFEGFACKKIALPAGDYSLLGYENSIAVERKSLDDFVQTVIHSQTRFSNELNKLGQYFAAIIVVEGTEQNILDHKYKSKAHPNSILALAKSITTHWNIPVQFSANRQSARHFTEQFLVSSLERILQCPEVMLSHLNTINTTNDQSLQKKKRKTQKPKAKPINLLAGELVIPTL